MGIRIAVDTGGTFSDVVVVDDNGKLRVGKAATTPERAFMGISRALASVAAEMEIELADMLGRTDLLVYGTTRATNAIVTGGTAKTALLITEGFGDTLVLREGGKRNPFDFGTRYPKPYVPRQLTFEIRERVNAGGEVLVPLVEPQVRKILTRLRSLQVEAVAVCLLWSIANERHEDRIASLIEEDLPGVPYTLSHRVNPVIREYRRASTATIDASLKPVMQTHLREFAADLGAAGFKGELLVVTSAGGVLDVHSVTATPILTVGSGPAMAPVAAAAYTKPGDTVVVCDVGGTTFDVSLLDRGQLQISRDTWLGEPFTGHLTGLASVGVKSIGAGGGSIAWIDPGGLLRVGPGSAGAVPGPACYGLGGMDPTVTDAAVVLGYLDPAYFLGGRVQLDIEASRRAIQVSLADPLGMEVEPAAEAVFRVANEQIVAAIRNVTIERGVDPRGATVVAGGGAGGMVACAIARALGCTGVVVPRTAGALSACGAQYADVVVEFSDARFATTADFDAAGVNAVLAQLAERANDFASSIEVTNESARHEYAVEARYEGQVWELLVPLPLRRFACRAEIFEFEQIFHREHERVLGVTDLGSPVECLQWRLRLTIGLPKPRPEVAGAGEGELVPRRVDSAWFSGAREFPRFAGETLTPGCTVSGPAAIDESTTTIVVPPCWRATVETPQLYILESATAEAR